MEVAREVDDDVFFADLNKQISLLIMDEDDGDVGPAMTTCPSVSLQALSQAMHHPLGQSPNLYEQTCRRQSKGTGVFIPRSSQPRRKNRQGRAAAAACNNTKLQRQQPENNSRGFSHHASYSDSFNPRRY